MVQHAAQGRDKSTHKERVVHQKGFFCSLLRDITGGTLNTDPTAPPLAVMPELSARMKVSYKHTYRGGTEAKAQCSMGKCGQSTASDTYM